MRIQSSEKCGNKSKKEAMYTGRNCETAHKDLLKKLQMSLMQTKFSVKRSGEFGDNKERCYNESA